MEEMFEKLKKEGKTDVDSLIQWMKDSKVIDESKAAEEKARALFSDVADKQKVELAKFNEALSNLATEQKKKVEDFTKVLAEEGPKRLKNALTAGMNAFKDALTKK